MFSVPIRVVFARNGTENERRGDGFRATTRSVPPPWSVVVGSEHVMEIAVRTALHQGLRSFEPDTEALRDRAVGAAHEQKPELRFAEFFEKLGVLATQHVEPHLTVCGVSLLELERVVRVRICGEPSEGCHLITIGFGDPVPRKLPELRGECLTN